MIETLSHPAQSAEFLSRLHDGELSPDEAAAFDSHRKECGECRASVAEYERALAAYRETAVTPHASDLSARILRKIRTASPSRRPFGVMFGIDVRWAGVLAAALLVVIIGAPVFRHRTPAPRTAAPSAGSRAPIPAYVLDAEDVPAPDQKAAAAPETRKRAAAKTEAAAPARENAAGFAAAPPSPVLQAGAAASAASAESAESRARADAPASTTDALASRAAPEPSSPTLQAQAPAAAPPAGSEERANIAMSRRQSAAAPPGGEGGGGAEEAPVSVKLSIQSADGQGEAPDLVHSPPDDRLAALRGRKFLLVVEVSGRVRAVEERTDDRKLAKDKSPEADAAAEASRDARALEASILRELVFQPGDRSRRILVAVGVR